MARASTNIVKSNDFLVEYALKYLRVWESVPAPGNDENHELFAENTYVFEMQHSDSEHRDLGKIYYFNFLNTFWHSVFKTYILNVYLYY